MAISMQQAISQNTAGASDARPVGVPESYEWYDGFMQGASAPPSNFTAVTGWGSVYQQAGEPAYSNPNARVEVANAQTYVHLKSTGEWVLVENQSANQIAGGQFVADLAGNEGTDMAVTTKADGTASFAAPPSGYNDHFWHGARGTYRAGDVDAVYVQMDMRVTDPNLNLVANVGADWWRDANAPFVDGFANNPGAGISNWVELSTDWQTVSFYSNPSVFKSDPPPTVSSSGTPSSPTTLTEPNDPTIAANPITPTEPTDPTDPAPRSDGDNLLVNGSFEATPVAANQWDSFDSISGWSAASGGAIELWNNLNGVKATNGTNFGELDYLSAADGLSQTVETEAGQRYALSFDARTRPGSTAATSTIEVLWNDKVVAQVPPGSDWSAHEFTVTGTGEDRLTFREAQGQSGDGRGALYDNVSLVAVNSTSSAGSNSTGSETTNSTGSATSGAALNSTGSAATPAVSQMDQAMNLMTQYSAADVSNTAPLGVTYQAAQQESLAPTITQTHQLT